MKITKAEIMSAQLHSSAYFSHAKMKDLNKDKYKGSGVIITVHDLSGKELIAPTVIRGGLSSAAIEAIKNDFKESQYSMLDFSIKS